MTDVVMFDLDGTLVDTPRAIVETFTATLAALGVQPQGADTIRATIGLPLEQAFGRLMGVPREDILVAQGVKQYQVLFREIILPKAATLVFPGVPEGLAALRARGSRLAVATSKFYASADALLRAAGLRDVFLEVVGADQVSQPKPHPEVGQLILSRLDCPPARAVMVGDTTHDLRMARAAGMRSIAVTYGVHGVAELLTAEPTWMVGSFDEVVSCITSEPART